MPRIAIVTPARAGTRNGNRHTATRWAAMLRSAGFAADVRLSWQGEKCDALLALHARRSHESVRSFRAQRPGAPLAVVLTGTDLYKDLPDSREARRSLELADRIVVLQDAALKELPAAQRRKARVVYQSSDCTLRCHPPAGKYRIAVVGHLRTEKDPFRAAAALALLRHRPDVEVVHIGGALDPRLADEAERLMKKDARYRWLGSLTHARTLAWIARSHVLVVSSVMEGGANVIAEAARIGTPVLASRMSGNVGMLGGAYPGFFPLFDEAALARLIERCQSKPFYGKIQKAMKNRKRLFAPAQERKALLRVVKDTIAARSSKPFRLSSPRR